MTNPTSLRSLPPKGSSCPSGGGRARISADIATTTAHLQLVQYLGELGRRREVFRNDAARQTVAALAHCRLSSRTPVPPNEAGISVSLIQRFAGGFRSRVCLGHSDRGGVRRALVRGERLCTAKFASRTKDGGVRGVPTPFAVRGTHSLAIERESLPAESR